jgi:hypothetical protein
MMTALRCLAVGLLFVAILGCGQQSADESTSGHEGVESTVQSYAVRGILAQLPSGPGKELMIRHEAIPEFVSSSGDTVGMDAMTMGFPTADGVSLDAFSVGDSVAFVFRVHWGGSPPLQLISMEPLAPGTALEFRKLDRP